MAKIRSVRGTHDLYGDEILKHRLIEQKALDIAGLYGFGEMETPIFEFTEVFSRSLGDTSDVVSKEMYTFTDRGGEGITLRPENTASIVRAVISGGLMQSPPLKYVYAGPMFRYERPQKGRLRQFHQFGAEFLGSPEPEADVEVIVLGAHIIEALGVAGDITLEINTLGDLESRHTYRDELVSFLKGYEKDLSEDSQVRLYKNPLRILDSKDRGDQDIIKNAPRLAAYLNDQSKEFFKRVEDGLAGIGIAYKLNPNIVRGLDYYTHTAFEFTTDALGAQGTVMAGGRYDGLFAQLGGPDTPGVGWASGIERLAMLIDAPVQNKKLVALVPIGDEASRLAFGLAKELRYQGVAVEHALKGKPAQRMKKADKIGATHAIFIGDDEIAKGVFKLRDLQSGSETELDRIALIQGLKP